MAQFKNVNWDLPAHASYDRAKLAVLMDIRDELRQLNAVFKCHNCLAIPNILRQIRSNTAKKKRTK
jgi:hypothetical protein